MARDNGTHGTLHIVGGPSFPATGAHRAARDRTGGLGTFLVDKDLNVVTESQADDPARQPVRRAYVEI